ncbi:hypothetical protein MPRS_14960 [Mycobacterium paraseoulense]|nr:hypothetical protein MPRS_14960 [Mycobacterium paraseoulense]
MDHPHTNCARRVEEAAEALDETRAFRGKLSEYRFVPKQAILAFHAEDGCSGRWGSLVLEG